MTAQGLLVEEGAEALHLHLPLSATAADLLDDGWTFSLARQ
jgi:hypothetical protein